MKILPILLITSIFIGCVIEHPLLNHPFSIRTTSDFFSKNPDAAVRIFYEGDVVPFAYFANDEEKWYHYSCDSDFCTISAFIGLECSHGCIMEWLVGETVVRRVRLLEHSDQETMEFSTVENGKEHVIVSKTWEIDLDSLINSQTTK